MSWTDLQISIPRVAGDPVLTVWPKLRSPELQNYRDIIVALPPSCGTDDRRYPLLVMHDGQNLFDPATSFAGDWGLMAALRELAADGVEAVVVGIANKGPFRKYEYSPFRDATHGGGDGDRYLDFIVNSVVPLVRRHFPVRADPSGTAMAGSSMGGLVSLYALYRHADLFGAAGALSPSAWFADEALRQLVESRPAPAGRIWLDVGGAEGEAMVQSVRRLRDALRASGLAEDRLHYEEDPVATHQEAYWGRRFRAVLPFLLAESRESERTMSEARLP